MSSACVQLNKLRQEAEKKKREELEAARLEAERREEEARKALAAAKNAEEKLRYSLTSPTPPSCRPSRLSDPSSPAQAEALCARVPSVR